MKTFLKRVDSSPVWNIFIILSIIVSVFGPSVAVIMGANPIQLLYLIFFSNILFVFDTLFKTILYGRDYVLSLDSLIDVSAIISAIMEFLLVLGLYAGPGVANLRILHSMKVLSRLSRGIKGVSRITQLKKASCFRGTYKKEGLLLRIAGFFTINSETEAAGAADSIYFSSIKQKMQSLVMLLMGYVIIRFGNSGKGLGDVQQAWNDIFFFLEMIAIMFVIGFFIDYYLRKLIAERFQRVKSWVKEKSSKHGFFKDVHDRAHTESTDEVDFLERYIGMVLDKASEFPESFRKFLWGVFKPQLRKKVIFLSDIEKYSERTAGMSATEINRLLDSYTKKAVGILVKHGAEIDKYVGDSIIAFFHPDNADGALDAAIDILNSDLPATRIALHCDDVIETYVGPKGYRQMDHFSEGVSIAQRLEEHNKDLGTYLLVSEDFYHHLLGKNQERLVKAGRFKPKGAKKTIQNYRLRV